VTIVATFFFVFIILLVKTPGHSPSEIGFVNCAVIAGALYAFVGMSHFLGGGINPAAIMGVMYAHNSQRVDSQIDFELDNDPNAYWRAYLFCPFIGGLLAGQLNRLHIAVLSQGSVQKVQEEYKEMEMNSTDA